MASDLLHMCLEGIVSLELEDGRSTACLKGPQLFRRLCQDLLGSSPSMGLGEGQPRAWRFRMFEYLLDYRVSAIPG
jgi:hypothetical protein